MAADIVSATMGVMNPLLGKLTTLLGEEYKKLKGVRKQATFLGDELSAMKALLDKMELLDKLDPSARDWRDHVREMSYDMENCIDDFMHDVEGVNAKKGFAKKMAQRLRRLGRRHQIADRIEELKLLAVEVSARRERFKIDDCISSSPASVAVDPRVPAIYKEAAALVGIDGPREELVSWLMDSQEKLKVASIVGFGGLGKTTLAKQVHDQIGGQFDRKAFVSVSQRPDMKSLLISLQRKLKMEESLDAHEVSEIVDSLREYLKHKRYFILVDDLWDQSAWNIIRCAFPENSNGSRVMVTTRLDDVAVIACHSDRSGIYRMKHLVEQDSRRLFFNRVFGSDLVCPPQYKEISDEILKKCGGLPLAIITIASLLASNGARSLNEWESVKNSLGAKISAKPPLEEMRGILNLSYMHLPVHLRPCLLYLGMYPEDAEIGRDDLVRQWIAEGFVSSSHGADLDDAGKSYFNELINKSLIQPEETYDGEVVSCRVHDMVLDLIISKSRECNFISVAYDYEDLAKLHSCKYNVRRLSLKSNAGSATLETLATSMSQVRSYAQFGESKYTPPLSQFKYLRLLLFEFPDRWDTTVDLTAIGHLFLLRYLKVLGRSASVALPTEIKGLVHLETLVLNCWSTQSFPSDMTCLANLIHLILKFGTVLPKGIQNMKSTRTLFCGNISETSLEDISGLSELTNLKELRLCTPDGQCLRVERIAALMSSIGMLRDLKNLCLHCLTESDGSESRLYSLPDPPPHLEVLRLYTWTLKRVPKWIGELRCLRMLSLFIMHLSSDEVCVLGELPSLISAGISGLDVSQDKVVISTGLFPVLEDVLFQSDDDVTENVSFEAGAMPKLQKLDLVLGWNKWGGNTPVGMDCLPCLQDVRVGLQETGAASRKDWEDVRAEVETAFKSAIRLHPKHPSVEVY
ncbi:unnamed protein product [Alopecurus aequalis]